MKRDKHNVLHRMYDEKGYPSWYSELSPEENTCRSCCIAPPEHVVPVVFIPGVMGSNLKFKKPLDWFKKKIAWQPDKSWFTAITIGNLSPEERRQVLNPNNTVLNEDVELHDNLFYTFKNLPIDVQDNWKQEFKRRGWGGVSINSYGEILCHLEHKLNHIFDHECDHEISAYWRKKIIDIQSIPGSDGKSSHPSWGVLTNHTPLSEDDLKEKVGDRHWFPVYAAGYNWLQSNKESGEAIATKVNEIIKHYRELGFECNKAILVTHSMGGLVARAACHAEMGKLMSSDAVAGVVHSVQPALGSATSYRRMRAGFEVSGGWNPLKKVVGIGTAYAVGWSGKEITAVLSNAPGCLELLPTKRYQPKWLKVESEAGIEMELPETDPYTEIYQEKEAWWRLVDPAWIEPKFPPQPQSELNLIWNNYIDQLTVAEKFHDTLLDYYHPETHAHYGADEDYKTWGCFTWQKGREYFKPKNGISLSLEGGPLQVVPPKGDNALGKYRIDTEKSIVEYSMMPPDEKGDGTVPEASAADSASKAKFAARMTGYDHQGSYLDKTVKDITAYCIARIAKEIG